MQSVGGIMLPEAYCDKECTKVLNPLDNENVNEKKEMLETKLNASFNEKETDYSKSDFKERHGFEPMRTVGPSILVEIYKNKLSETISIVDKTRDKQKWSSNVGRVCYIGNACYKDERFKDWDILPNIGDWVTFKPGSGAIFKYRGIDVSIIYDDSVVGITEDPEYITRD